MPDTAVSTNRYAQDWNAYSAEWERRYGARYAHLGDEWCDDGSPERKREYRLFAHLVEPWLGPGCRALEIGPGGGKWTTRLAPKVADLVVYDVAEEMLARTRARVEAAGLSNVTFVRGDGRELAPLGDGSIDLVFSYDVFVHIALEDTVAYLAEIARVLREGGVAIVHHAVADVPPAWDRIERHHEWYRDPAHTLGQYYYFSRDALDRLYDRFGLRVESTWTEYCTTVMIARKPARSIVPGLEQALRHASSADAPESLETAIAGIEQAGADLSARLVQLTGALRAAEPGTARHDVIQEIRTLVRG